VNMDLDCASLRIIADLTSELTAMRLQNCGHLCIENVAPEIFGKLIYEFRTSGEHRLQQVTQSINVDDLLRNEP
jgi:hypothetical protein